MSRGGWVFLWTTIALLAALGPGSAPADAAPEAPRNLEVSGGSAWRADSLFFLHWRDPEPATPVAAVRYLLRNESDEVVSGPRRVSPTESLFIETPKNPGAYRIEVWLEGGDGAQGPAASTLLRFDDSRPGPAFPIRHANWIGRREFPFLARIEPPSWTPAASGIRGYAVSVDRDPGGAPCAAPLLCTDDETDLRAGLADTTLELGELPEGLLYLHAVAVSGAGVHSAEVESVPLWVDSTDPVTRLSGAPEGWTSHPVTLRASAADAASGMRDEGPDGPFTAIAVDGGPPSVSPGASSAATIIASGVHTVAFYARDAAGNADDGVTVNGRRDPAPPTATVRIDRDPPRVAFLPSTHPDDPELIEARIRDPLSGPDATRGWIGVRAAGSGIAFEPLPTVADGDRLRARWNSDDYPRGEYEFEALGRDRAGNVAVGTRREAGSAMVLPSPLKAETTLEARFLGARPGPSGSIAFGRGVLYRGRLTLASGTPLAGTALRVVERFAPASALPPRSDAVETGADGSFETRLAPGPSRSVQAIFAGSGARARSASRPLELAVRGGIDLRASSRAARVGGRPVIFSGRIGGEVPVGGLPVELQFHLPGVPWTEFRTVQSDNRGRFRYAYAFTDDDSRGVRFLFRAAVGPASGWPYDAGASLPVAVRGR